MCPPTTLELVRRAKAGDVDAFRELMERSYERLYASVAAWSMGLTDEDREDILQRIWLDAWQGLAGFREESAFETWLWALARNRAFRETDRIRRSRPPDLGATRHDSEDDPSALPHAPAAETLEDLAAQEALDHLCLALRGQTEQRRNVYRRYIAGRTATEIAEEFGLTRNHVDQTLFQVRKIIRTQFIRLGYAAGEAHLAVRRALRLCHDVFAYCVGVWEDGDSCE